MKWSRTSALGERAVSPADGPRLFYSKSFPGSVPAYMQVTLEKTGDAEYREAEDDDLPLKFQLHRRRHADVFGLADKLDHFKHPLESPLESGLHGRRRPSATRTATRRARPSSTTPRTLRRSELLDWFERMAESARTASTWSAPPSTTSWAWSRRCRCWNRRWSASGWWARSVPADARPHRQERNLHAHGPRAGRRNRRGHPRAQAIGGFLMLPPSSGGR